MFRLSANEPSKAVQGMDGVLGSWLLLGPDLPIVVFKGWRLVVRVNEEREVLTLSNEY